MELGAHLKVVRRGALHAFDRHDPSTFPNGFFLFATIALAFIGAIEVGDDDVVWYVLLATAWILSVYWHGFELLGHVVELQEEVAEPHESLQAIRQRVEVFPITGMLPFLAVMGFT